ncbi:aldo/keto reductase [Rhizobium sp. Leaf386]|uniref:aldo/keto reductase n=1 Tax=Rhizobium sp. Leaf386 TaxID=1736359 RepID=UPI00071609C7|nr:aldo/keto reductase [Rhizobium sp. Leaf386]KQS95540.1 2,5-diketo-D-gluconic acid reductase [Rhizobium sp. Leaf386]
MTVFQKAFPLNPSTAIPSVGFGTYLIADGDAENAVRTAISLGYRHIDTAEVYENEKGVGAGIQAGLSETGLAREDIFVTTKLWPGHAAWGQELKNEEKTIAAFNASLERLGLDYVDLYLIHSPHGGPERLNQWRALLELQRVGKARSIGVSNFGEKHLEEIKAAGLALPEANQIELHPWSQKPTLVGYMKDHDIAPIAYSSLAPLSTWRIEDGQDSAKTEQMRISDGVLASIAAKYGVTEAQLLLRWGVQSGYPVLPKSLNPERMRQNIDLDGFTIDDGDLASMKSMDRGGGLAWSIGDPSYID